jgi:NAD(P)H-dependent flavin oxidoreductase YrpB (nitropropane dioxygenase family)
MEKKHFLSEITIFQGGMGVGVSLGGLAGAVAAEGGAGTISTAQIGFREPDFEKNPLQANLRAIGKELKKAREIAGGRGLIGVNIMTVTRDYAEYVKEAVRQGVDFIVSGAGLPMELPALAKGSDAKLIPVVSSFKAASVICKRWLKKDGVIPDAVIIEGPEAGGHLGFNTEQLESDGYYGETSISNGIDSRQQDAEGYCQEPSISSGIDSRQQDAKVSDGERQTAFEKSTVERFSANRRFDAEIQEIISYLREFGETHGVYIPVITAGGFRNRADLEHQRTLGADAIQLATRFVVTEECDADIRFKQAYVNCRKEDIAIVKSPVGMPGRALRNAFIKKTEQGRIAPKRCLGCISICRPSETPYCITQALIRAVTGDTENGLVFCGAKAWMEDKITTVREVMRAFEP